MNSMTGYGEASGEGPRWAIRASLKAVNHRFLDLQIRLPEEMRQLEGAVRDALTGGLARGRVEVRLDIRPVAEREARVVCNRSVVAAAHAAVQPLIDQGLVERGLSAGDLLRLPEAFRVELDQAEFEDEDRALLLSVVGEALAQLRASREAEGKSLGTHFDDRLTGLSALVDRLVSLSAQAREEIQAGLRKRLADLLQGLAVDEGRLAQEVALLVDRSDVSEELDRLRSHHEHFRAVMADPAPAGKRLDFLTQEIFRELNTLGSKCRHAEMTRAVLDAKVLCEQIREQVQNVE
jgi:uncharacterized protein (TIGR00255 family)